MKTNRNYFSAIVVGLFATLLIGCAQPQKTTLSPECSKVRAGFDIGSGTIKVKVAQVDICNKRIFRFIAQDARAVAFQENMVEVPAKKKPKKGTKAKKAKQLPNHILETGKDKFRELINFAVKNGAEQAGGVATQAFREAINGRTYIQELEEIGSQYMPSRLIVVAQDLEASIGFEAGIHAIGASPTDVVIWDIGGGSQQLSTPDMMQPKRLITFKGDFASTSFMKTFPTKVYGARPSPNPIGKIGSLDGIQRARDYAKKNIPPQLRDKIAGGAEVIGIGGVISKSVRGQLSKTEFTAEDISNELSKRMLWTDKQLGGDYANTQVTNLVLVLGLMQELGITKVKAVDANLADGVLLAKEFWITGN